MTADSSGGAGVRARVRGWVESARGEGRRAAVATALGAALGLIAVVFARRERRGDGPPRET